MKQVHRIHCIVYNNNVKHVLYIYMCPTDSCVPATECFNTSKQPPSFIPWIQQNKDEVVCPVIPSYFIKVNITDKLFNDSHNNMICINQQNTNVTQVIEQCVYDQSSLELLHNTTACENIFFYFKAKLSAFQIIPSVVSLLSCPITLTATPSLFSSSIKLHPSSTNSPTSPSGMNYYYYNSLIP